MAAPVAATANQLARRRLLCSIPSASCSPTTTACLSTRRQLWLGRTVAPSSSSQHPAQAPRWSLQSATNLSRRQSHRRMASTSAFTPAWSEGTDVAEAAPLLEALLASASGKGKWTLRRDGAALERHFSFKTFKAAWAFMNGVAQECKTHKHHPEWSNVYSKVYVRWTTHMPAGLSVKDVRMARICDDVAAAQGEVVTTDSSSSSGERQALAGVADTVASQAGDCCVPASARTAEKARIEAEEGGEAAGSVAGMGGQPS